MKDFFTILSQQETESGASVTISFNQEHPVFEGHFPGNPIVPGVCLVQVIGDSIGFLLQRKLKLLACDNAKFLKLIQPLSIPEVSVLLSYSIADDIITVTASIVSEGDTLTKFRGRFINFAA
jgi:3-hydroxyacyl-[acyl-carrier-protein] dehydratase